MHLLHGKFFSYYIAIYMLCVGCTCVVIMRHARHSDPTDLYFILSYTYINHYVSSNLSYIIFIHQKVRGDLVEALKRLHKRVNQFGKTCM